MKQGTASRHLFLTASLLLASITLVAAASDDRFTPDLPEAGSVEAIAAATTSEDFVNDWIGYLPDSETVPSPTDYLGHIAGAPGELSSTSQIYGYMRALAAASPRVTVEVIGTTEEGREIILVIIADEQGINDLEQLRQATARLADPRSCDDECLQRTLASARPVYFLNGGLHSTETGSPEMLMELAYRPAVSKRAEIQEIREQLVVLINPVSEPDGRDRMAEWFYRYLKGKTDRDHLPYLTPPYWGHYVFHDNNRDTHMLSLALTRAVEESFHHWHPQVIHELHESIPLLQIWTGTGPYNLQMDPILIGEMHAMAFHEVRTLSSLGMPGVWTWAFGEGWAHVYLDSIAINHNAIGRGYETFGLASAETMDVRLNLNWNQFAGKPVTKREWYRPWPPPRKFRWSLRNNVNYQQTGVLSILHYTALHAPEMLRDFWRKGQRAVALGTTEKPFAFAIPEDQSDRRRLAALVNLLRAHRIEVSRAHEPFTVKKRQLPAGTYLVRLDQPYRGYAVDLLEAQRFPADDAQYQPYDDVSWALPYHFGIEVIKVDDPAIREVAVELVSTPVAYEGRVAGKGRVLLLRDTGQDALLAARFRLAQATVEVAEQAFSHDDTEYPPGSWIISGDLDMEDVGRLAADLSLDLVSVATVPEVAKHLLDLPRLAIMHTWSDTESVGWLRLVLDREQIPYAYINDDDIKSGGLAQRFDLIVYPHTYDSLKGIIQGIDPGHGPLAYTRTEEYPSHGTPDASPDITGGLGYAGIANLQEFVQRGGMLVTLGGASTLPLDGGFVREVGRARTKKLSTPGIEIRTRFPYPDHPLAYGYPEITSVFRGDLPLYETREADLGWVVLQWGTKPPRFGDPDIAKDGPWGGQPDKVEETEGNEKEAKKPALVLSGGMKGEDEIDGKPAILDIPVGQGRVVAFNFDPIHRTMNRSDFRLLWNVILNWNDLPSRAAAPSAPPKQ
jgi:hypothetical protein